MANAFDDISPPPATAAGPQLSQMVIQPQTAPQPTQRGNAFDDISPSAFGAGHLTQGGSYFRDTSTPEWQAKYGPLSGQSDLEIAREGIGRGLEHTWRSLANMVGLVPDQTLTDEHQIDQALMSNPSGHFGSLIGESAATAPLGMGASSIAGRVLPEAIAGSRIFQGALQGGLQGAATADPNERGAQALAGALTGGGLGVGTGLGNLAVRGTARTAAAQRLIDQGIDLTPGQMNPRGAMNQFEQASESIPGVHQIVDPARQYSQMQARALMIQGGAAPGARIAPSNDIHDMLRQAYESYGPLYDQARGYPVRPSIMMSTGPDIPLSTALESAAQAPGVPQSLQQSERAWLADRLTQLPPHPDSGDLLNLRSEIRQRGREMGLRTDVNAAHIANIQHRADDMITESLQSQLPQEPLQALRTADSNYGNYKVIESAVAKSKDNLAGLTPQKLSQAISESVPDAAYAHGAGGPLRDLARDTGAVFQNVSPPSGARILTLGGAAGLGAYHPGIAVPLGAAALGAVGTQTGRRLAQGVTAPQQAAQRLAAALQGGGPLQQGVVGAGGQLLQRGATGALLPYGQAALPAAYAGGLYLAQKAGLGKTAEAPE